MSIDPPDPGRPPLPFAHISGEIIGAFFETYNALGFGFLESVYRRSLRFEIESRGLEVLEEAPVEVTCKGRPVGHFRLDLLVEHRIAVEIKAAMILDPTAKRQLTNYLRACTLDVGLLLHFGPQPRFHRVVPPRMFGAPRDQSGWYRSSRSG